jgi:hypothetical protein
MTDERPGLPFQRRRRSMEKTMKSFFHSFHFRILRPVIRFFGELLLRLLPIPSRRGGIPRGVIRDSAAWVRERNARLPHSERRQDYWQVKVRGAELADGRPPRTIESAIDPVFDKYRLYQFPELTVTHLLRGRVALADGVIISPDDRVFEEFVHQWGKPVSTNQALHFPGLPRPVYRSGVWASLVVPAAGSNVGHWLFDGLLRLAVLEEAGLARHTNLILPSRTTRYTEMVEMLGYDSSRYNGLEGGHWELEHLLVPSYVSMSGILRPWACRWLRNRLQVEDKPVGKRRLWVSRGRAKWRRLLNEDEIFPLLQKMDFERIDLEDLSFRQQVDLFSQAAVVAGPHGAGLTNLIFAPHGIRVLELFAPTFVNPVFYSMTNALAQEYYYCVGSIPEGAAHPKGLVDLDHFAVAPEKIERALREMAIQ